MAKKKGTPENCHNCHNCHAVTLCLVSYGSGSFSFLNVGGYLSQRFFRHNS